MAEVFYAKNLFAQNQTITQNQNDGFHSGTGACDYSHANKSGKLFYAPCRMKLVKIHGTGTGNYDANTYFYESTEKVIFAHKENGYYKEDYLSMSFGHMEDNMSTGTVLGSREQLNLTVGSIVNKGDVIYYEGNKGNSKGNHCHIRISTGKFTGDCWAPSPNYPANYVLTTTGRYLNHDEAFFINDYNFSNTKGLVFKTYQALPVKPTGIYLCATKQVFRVRNKPVSGFVYHTVNLGERAEILSFGEIESDGYQWVHVRSRGIDGYAQLDTHNCYTLYGVPNNRYLCATKQPFRVRNTPVNGAQLSLVNIGGRALILEFLPIQSDGYQWARVSFGGVVGFSQIDTNNCYTVV